MILITATGLTIAYGRVSRVKDELQAVADTARLTSARRRISARR